MGAGALVSPLPKTPQQGDAARLEQLETGLKQTGGTHGPVVQKTPAGRPVGTGGTPAPRQSQGQFQISPEQQALFDELAQAEVARQYWSQMASTSPTPWVQTMREIAERNYQLVAAKVFNTTPNAGF